MPVACDVDMISGFFVEFARAHKLGQLMLFMKYSFRKIECMNCDWHQAYYKIFDAVQEQMSLSYGSTFRLHVKENFECFLCHR